MHNKPWQDVVSLIAGVGLTAAPWALGVLDGDRAMVYNAVAVGLAIAFFALADLAKEERWEPVVSLLLGLWAVASPWVLGFAAAGQMMVVTVAAGAIVAVVSLWQIVERYDLTQRLLH